LIVQFLFQEIFVNFFIIILSVYVITKINIFQNVKTLQALFIYFYHSLFMVIMIFYNFKNPGDSNFIWKSVDDYNFDLFISNGFMKFILFFFKHIIHLSYSNLILLVNLIGTIGILFFFDFLKNNLSEKKIVLIFSIILLPSLHLWTNTYIKDSFILTLLFIFFWAESQKKNYNNLQIFLLILIFAIRPYLGILFLFPFFIKIYLNSSNKILLTLPLILSSILISSFLLIFLRHHTLDISSFNPFETISYILSRFDSIQHGSSFIDTDKFFLVNMISYLFSPIFYPFFSINPINVILICESILLIFIFFYLFKNYENNFNLIKFLYFLSLLLLLFIVSETTTNIGIVLRQKWTILIFFIYILVDGQKKKL